MSYIFLCRRTVTALFAISCLTALGIYKGFDTSMSIASVAIGLAGANAYEKSRMVKDKLP